MQRLLLFLYQYRAFFLFVLLEVLSAWFIIKNNPYQGAAFFNSSSYLAGSVLDTKQDVNDYFGLKTVNEKLAEENARLRKALTSITDTIPGYTSDTLAPFIFYPAKVISNSTRRAINFITINKGSNEGIEPDMAVINAEGVVGKVKTVSRRYATITSLLHPDLYISSVIKSSGSLCSVKWGGKDPAKADLLYVPRHLKVSPGDTVVTSGYNAIFPPGIKVGIISEVDIKEDATFYDIKIDLITEFDKLSYVYVVRNRDRNEIDSLKQTTLNIR